MSFRLSILPLLLGLALSGCATVGPDYQAPVMRMDAQWQAALPHGGSTTALLDWWQSFNDPVLSSLLQAAEADSPTLDKALAAIASARTSDDEAGLSGLPTLSASASDTHSGSKGGNVGRSSSALLDASWELDLFGRVRRSQQATQAALSASQADWHDARVTLAAEVASEYVNYRACQLQAARYQDNHRSLQQAAGATAAAVQAGLSAAADGALVEASLASANSSLLAQQAECEVSIKSLVALTGLAEPALRAQLASEPDAIPQPGTLRVDSVPLQLLSQRPDLVSAERSLAAASARIGVAEAERYPRLSLLGSLSSTATRGSGNSQGWSFGPTLSLPVFDGGSGKAAVQTAQANYQSALAGYRGAVRSAVQEVEQALVRLDSASRREASVATAAANYGRYFAASLQSWQAGSTSLLDLEESRRNALSAEQSLITVQRDRVLYGISLYKALGGGWQAGGPAAGKGDAA
ncbi:efflux transporter outer membrane subunit [Vogesella sp. LIG4]|uniref:efflux transporter outer membrane subunit n=1 Tax=Vogesella sp. LIG4 TaxID=1192162 RepID=UPI00081FCFCD|nr:efflux transporter outer membrane subunit [Vogesella sp. LIG4]SCK21629.1 efflux transporter, outer membrane factor (OMF) lipoprotein, NodT family [Vogesella sp. LIG4]